MRLDKVTLNEDQLTKIDGAFASTRKGYKKTAIVIFTNGKSDRLWQGGSPTDAGITYPWAMAVDEDAQRCGGFCLVDLLQVMEQNRKNNQGVGINKGRYRLEPASLRHTTLITVVHELFHINQGWMFGKTFMKEFYDEIISAEARYEDFAAANSDMPPTPYMQNVFERGAFDFVSRWWEANAVRINSGAFDFLLPVTVMNGLFPDRAPAFR